MMRRILTILIICIVSFHVKAQNNNLIKGYIQLKEGNYLVAMEIFKSELDETQTPKAFLYHGICNYHLGNTEQATQDFLKVYNSGQISEVQLWLAKAYAQAGDAQQAVLNLKGFISSQTYIQTNTILKDSAFKFILNSESWQDYIFNRTASSEEKVTEEVAYLLNNNKYREGIEYISDLLLDQSDAHLYFYRALFYKASGNLALAYSDIGYAANDVEENIIFFKEYFQIASDYNKHERAILILEELLELEEENPVWIKEKAIIELKLKQTEEALNSITTYLQYYPYDKASLYLKAEIHIEKEEYNDAIRTLNMIDKNFTATANLYLLRGECFLNTGTFKSAAYDFSMCLDLDPTNKEANLNLGIVQNKLGNTASACFYWERALQYGSLKATEHLQKYCE